MIREIDLNTLYKRAQKKMETNVSECPIKMPNSYIIKLTTDCNLRCQYCYMGDSIHSQNMMSNELFEHILNQIKDNNSKFTVYLHGGEPCLRLDLILQLKSWIEQNHLNDFVNIMLQTNGTIVNQDIIRIIKDMNIHVGVSIDGIYCDTNRARVYENNQSTVENVIKNIELFLSENIRVGIFSVLTAYNANSMLDFIKYFGGIGVRDFVINPLVLWGNAKNKSELTATPQQVYECYKQIIDWLGDYNLNCGADQRITERNLHWWFQGLTTGTKGYMCNCSPCGAGIQTIAISTTGDVYICDQYYGDDKFLIGNIGNTDLKDVMRNAQTTIDGLRNIYNIETCKHCIWRYVCCGGCSATSYYYYGNMNSVAPNCEAYKKIFSYLDIRSQQKNIVL